MNTTYIFSVYLAPILTFIVGLITIIINYYISKKLRNNTTENLKLQIDNSIKLKMIELQSSNNITNRQAWMNQFRESISEYIGIMYEISFNVKETKITIDKLFYLNKKISLLLHPKRPLEKKAIDLITSITVKIFLSSSINEKNEQALQNLRLDIEELTNTSREILDHNWEKIKNGNNIN